MWLRAGLAPGRLGLNVGFTAHQLHDTPSLSPRFLTGMLIVYLQSLSEEPSLVISWLLVSHRGTSITGVTEDAFGDPQRLATRWCLQARWDREDGVRQSPDRDVGSCGQRTGLLKGRFFSFPYKRSGDRALPRGLGERAARFGRLSGPEGGRCGAVTACALPGARVSRGRPGAGTCGVSAEAPSRAGGRHPRSLAVIFSQ